MIGPLSKKEKEGLALFADFYNQLDEPTQKSMLCDCMMGKTSSYPILKQMKIIFSPKYKIIWDEAQKKLISAQKDILKTINFFGNKLEVSFTSLGTFFGKDAPEKIRLDLIFSPISQMSGKSVGKDHIAINVSSITSRNDQIRLCLLILHEIVHAHYEDDEYKNKLKQFIIDQTEPHSSLRLNGKNILRETIVTCFASSGILRLNFEADALEKIKNKIEEIKSRQNELKDNIDFLKMNTSYEMLITTREYLEKKKQIDQKYIESVWSILKKYFD
jgi:hypothetical protein